MQLTVVTIGVARMAREAADPLLFFVPALVKDQPTLIEQSVTLIKHTE